MVMAGDGPERARMEALAQNLGVAERITFLGMVPHDRALEVIRNADVAVFTGMREEGGLALAEALLMGTPVVVLANGGADAIAQAATRPDLVSRIEPASTKTTVAAMARALDVSMEREQGHQKAARGPLLDQEGSVEALRSLVNQAVSGTEGADR
jgi:glycosyltransferase involved in cell wall biosynthesis